MDIQGRVSKERREDDLRPLIERRGGEERRIPEWRRRALAGQGQAVDLTGQVKVAA